MGFLFQKGDETPVFFKKEGKVHIRVKTSISFVCERKLLFLFDFAFKFSLLPESKGFIYNVIPDYKDLYFVGST